MEANSTETYFESFPNIWKLYFFPKWELFYQKFQTFREKNQMELKIWVYLKRFSSLLGFYRKLLSTQGIEVEPKTRMGFKLQTIPNAN